MSRVTNMMILTFVRESGIEEVNKWLVENEHQPLVEISEHAGGPRAMECRVWAAAQNYLDHEKFEEFVKTVRWQHLDHVQVLLKGQHDDLFSMVTPFEEKGDRIKKLAVHISESLSEHTDCGGDFRSNLTWGDDADEPETITNLIYQSLINYKP